MKHTTKIISLFVLVSSSSVFAEEFTNATVEGRALTDTDLNILTRQLARCSIGNIAQTDDICRSFMYGYMLGRATKPRLINSYGGFAQSNVGSFGGSAQVLTIPGFRGYELPSYSKQQSAQNPAGAYFSIPAEGMVLVPSDLGATTSVQISPSGGGVSILPFSSLEAEDVAAPEPLEQAQ